MKLSYCTNGFTSVSLDEALATIAAIGYQGVEILADTPHLYPPEVTGDRITALRDTLSRLHLPVANLNANTAVGYYGCRFWEPLFEPSLANPEEGPRAWRRQYTESAITIAAALGADMVSITSGRPTPGNPPEVAIAILLDSLREILPHAEDHRIRLAIEYEPGLLVEDCRDLEWVLDRIGSASLGANLDLGHSHVLGEDPDEVCRRLAGSIFHVHLEDIRYRKHYHLPPGEGDMDFAALLRHLARAGYDGFVSVELYTQTDRAEAAATQAFTYLNKLPFWN